jgi:proteasome lid subunit RPN8/RPN11
MDLPPDIRAAMVAHARFCYPEEACGLLAVDAGGGLRMVYCCTNVERSPVSYTLDPTEHLRAMLHAERNGWVLGGVFHSHTHSPAFPSRTDVARALEPEWLYALVSLDDPDDPDVRGFWIRDGNITEEPLVVSGGGTQ